MALAIDGSSPAVFTISVAANTSASFTPPAGSLLLIAASCSSTGGANPSVPGITDNLGGHLTYNLIAFQSHVDSAGRNGQAALWWALVGSSAAMTVTITNHDASQFDQAAKIWVLTGQHATPVGASGKAGSASAASIAQSYTATATGGQGFISVCDWAGVGTETAGTGCTVDGSGTVAGTISYGFARRTTADDTNGGNNTLNVTLPGTSTQLNWAYVEIVPAGAASIPFNPQRAVWVRDPSETYFEQKDRRNALLVSTAANDLAEPLFQPASAQYWHLYNDTAARDRRMVPQQRPYVSDPSLLTQVGAVTPTVQRTVATRDYGEVQWLQAPRRDPLLLTTALLENELLGGAETAKRYLVPATHDDRREVPSQRQYYDTSLLTTALLENVLLGGADTGRHLTWFTDRREVPQQRTYFDPTLLLTALLEGPLLAGDTRRHYAAATFTDRREVPQQRPYISDPSFYPSTTPTDPLTLAWGAGGQYWHLYNDWYRPSAQPQERRYISDPLLLTTALLEPPLQVGSFRQTYTDRRVVPQQLRWLAVPAELADPLLVGGAGSWRYYGIAATHVSRRQTAFQPVRQTFYSIVVRTLSNYPVVISRSPAGTVESTNQPSTDNRSRGGTVVSVTPPEVPT